MRMGSRGGSEFVLANSRYRLIAFIQSRPPHGAARVIQRRQRIHGSVLEAIKTGTYRPVAQFEDGTTWDNLDHIGAITEIDFLTSALATFASISTTHTLNQSLTPQLPGTHIGLITSTSDPLAHLPSADDCIPQPPSSSLTPSSSLSSLIGIYLSSSAFPPSRPLTSSSSLVGVHLPSSTPPRSPSPSLSSSSSTSSLVGLYFPSSAYPQSYSQSFSPSTSFSSLVGLYINPSSMSYHVAPLSLPCSPPLHIAIEVNRISILSGTNSMPPGDVIATDTEIRTININYNVVFTGDSFNGPIYGGNIGGRNNVNQSEHSSGLYYDNANIWAANSVIM